MANEAKKVELYGSNCEGDVRRYTCADANAITKGTLLVLSDPRTASGGATSGAQFAGIAAVDKEASDGSTSIGCWTNGIFELTATGASRTATRSPFTASSTTAPKAPASTLW